MTYLGQGYPWTKNQPPTLEPSTLCDCGRPRAGDDFLCGQCRAEIERQYRQEEQELRCTECNGRGSCQVGDSLHVESCDRCKGLGIIAKGDQ